MRIPLDWLAEWCLPQAILVIGGRRGISTLHYHSHQLRVFGFAARASTDLAMTVGAKHGIPIAATGQQLRQRAPRQCGFRQLARIDPINPPGKKWLVELQLPTGDGAAHRNLSEQVLSERSVLFQRIVPRLVGHLLDAASAVEGEQQSGRAAER